MNVATGDSITYVITPNAGFKIKYIQVDNKLIRSRNTYTFTNISSNHIIKAWFTGSTANSLSAMK
jgi:hypothetical protein